MSSPGLISSLNLCFLFVLHTKKTFESRAFLLQISAGFHDINGTLRQTQPQDERQDEKVCASSHTACLAAPSAKAKARG
jgi:hypothetical protein